MTNRLPRLGLHTRSLLVTVVLSVSEPVFSSFSELSAPERALVPASRTGVGRVEGPPVGLLRRSLVILGCSSGSGRRPRRAPAFPRSQS